MSILSMPTFSSGPISNWVMMESSPSAFCPEPLVGAVQTGMYSLSGPGAITTPAAWTEACREIPSIRLASMMQRSYCGLVFTSSRNSGTLLIASSIVSAKAGPDGISLVSLSASPGGMRRRRATSFTAARAFSVPKVMICPTLARP